MKSEEQRAIDLEWERIEKDKIEKRERRRREKVTAKRRKPTNFTPKKKKRK